MATNDTWPPPHLSAELRRARLALGLTQAEVARRAGTAQYVVSNLEAGKTNSRIGTVLEVARALGLDLRLLPLRLVPAWGGLIAADRDGGTVAEELPRHRLAAEPEE